VCQCVKKKLIIADMTGLYIPLHASQRTKLLLTLRTSREVAMVMMTSYSVMEMRIIFVS
jgi:hypothetical protein